MNFEYSKYTSPSNVIVYHLKGDLIDKGQCADLLAEIEAFIAIGSSKFVFDFTNLVYMNSTGLNILINILTKARKCDGDISISNLNPKIKQLLVVTKLTTVFNITDTTEEAIKKLE